MWAGVDREVVLPLLLLAELEVDALDEADDTDTDRRRFWSMPAGRSMRDLGEGRAGHRQRLLSGLEGLGRRQRDWRRVDGSGVRELGLGRSAFEIVRAS